MSAKELLWRLQQRAITRKERRLCRDPFSVAERTLTPGDDNLTFDRDALGLFNFSNSITSVSAPLHLPGGFDYDNFRTAWNAGFQTRNEWPVAFHADVEYKQNDETGDARTNWELNRHFQFAQLAKDSFATGDKAHLDTLKRLLDDWCSRSPYLHGISWTSPMEIAIRAISWMTVLAFIPAEETGLRLKLQNGVINMVRYVEAHYSRFSSANNHLIIEMLAIGLAGLAFGKDDWTTLAVSTLDKQLGRQNSRDGVNLEMSLHYQTFVMEAYALMMHAMKANGIDIPRRWEEMLAEMCAFVACSMYGNDACEFGDNDEGKIIDLAGGHVNHYRYVLQLCSLVLRQRFESFDDVSETVRWLFTDSDIAGIIKRPKSDTTASRTFAEGGYSFLRSADGDILIGIDHARLGFGSIAAHGHADALSFQLFSDGKAVLTDPGTSLYHCGLDERDRIRRTASHNTVEINSSDQSEMLGAFLWGRKAKTRLLASSLTPGLDTIEAETAGINGIRHRRRFTFDKEASSLEITDTFSRECDWTATFIVAPGLQVKAEGRKLTIGNNWSLKTGDGTVTTADFDLYTAYGIKATSKAIKIKGRGTTGKIHLQHLNQATI